MDPTLVERFAQAVAAVDVDPRIANIPVKDADADAELRAWLDGNEDLLPWADPVRVTADEWFFVTTLYGEMTLAGQRTHIRRYFHPLFVDVAKRDIRNFVPGLAAYKGLRASWMPARLCKMSEILRRHDLTMEAYAEKLRGVDRTATPDDPTPALDRIIRDHKATGWKTLSVFVRDCIRGNCFPIDTRVQKALNDHRLPAYERTLVGLSLAVRRNPRELARKFYWVGGS